MPRRATATIMLAGLVALTGCTTSDDAGTEPPAACLDDMREAASITDPAEADPVLVRTLTSCGTAEQWLEALRRYPAAMGLNERAQIGEVDLDAACGAGNTDTPVCRSR